MKKIVYLFILMFGFFSLGNVNAAVLTFDDIGTTQSYGTIPNGYGGLNWAQFGYINGSSHSPGSGYDNGTVSGDYTAFNFSGNVGTVNGTLFDFNGAYLTAAWNTGLSIKVTGSANSLEKFSQTVTVNTDDAAWFDFNFIGIDALSFRSFGGTDAGLGRGTHFAMDNFTYNESAPVPEPATMLLFGLGLIGLAGVNRRKK